MTVEELRDEASKLGYCLIKLNQKPVPMGRAQKCTCGAGYPHLYADKLQHVAYRNCIKCGKKGPVCIGHDVGIFRMDELKRLATRGWNEMIDEELVTMILKGD